MGAGDLDDVEQIAIATAVDCIGKIRLAQSGALTKAQRMDVLEAIGLGRAGRPASPAVRARNAAIVNDMSEHYRKLATGETDVSITAFARELAIRYGPNDIFGIYRRNQHLLEPSATAESVEE